MNKRTKTKKNNFLIINGQRSLVLTEDMQSKITSVHHQTSECTNADLLRISQGSQCTLNAIHNWSLDVYCGGNCGLWKQVCFLQRNTARSGLQGAGKWLRYSGWLRIRPIKVMWLIFTARRYASAVYTVVVCLSVCPSVCHKPILYRNDKTYRVSFWHGSFLWHIVNCVVTKFGYLQNKGTFLWSFAPSSGLRKFRHGKSMVSSTKLVDGRACGLHLRPSSMSCLDAQSLLLVGQL